jgi:hypothetical protein
MKPHRKQVEDTFEALAYLVKRLDHDGMDLQFTMSPDSGHSRHREALLAKLRNVSYDGKSCMELTLGRALSVESNKQRWSASSFLNRENNWAKSIYILTDGKWHGEDDSLCGIPELIAQITKKMDNRVKLGIQFIQFGNDLIGTWRLKELDDGLQKCGIMEVCLIQIDILQLTYSSGI